MALFINKSKLELCVSNNDSLAFGVFCAASPVPTSGERRWGISKKLALASSWRCC